MMNPTPASAAERPGANDDAFFRHHGVWAPGVRLFRRHGFKAKALLISLAFVVPIWVLAHLYFTNKAAAIEFSAKELHGVAYGRELMPLVPMLQLQRLWTAQHAVLQQLPPELAALGPAVQERIRRIEAVEAELGHELGTTAAFAAMRQAIDKRSDASAGLEPVFASHTAAVEAALALVTQVADGSNLTLDPDIDTYYLMDAAFFRLSPLMESIGWVRGVTAAGAAGSTLPPAMVRRFAQAETLSDASLTALRDGLAKVTALHPDAAQTLSLQPIRDPYSRLTEMMRAIESGVAARPAAGDVIAAGTAAIEASAAMQVHALAELERLIGVRLESMESERRLAAALTVLFVAVGGYLFYSFYLVMSGGLAEVRRHLEAITQGDLTTVPSPWGQDEAARLMLALGAMQDSLLTIVHQVRGASGGVLNSAQEIAAGAMDLSGRTEQSAANLQQSAASIEQLSGTVRNTSDAAGEAAGIAAANSAVAERGSRVIAAMVDTMRDINTGSSRIGEIIGTIDGIAFQTNILALNAAVEAARAGDAGRGFAVVASEVRALAHRSSTAAREIKSLIVGSIEKVEAGTRIVREAGDAVGEIVGNANRVSQLLATIATAAREQAAGIDQTTRAVQEMDGVTQRNAALVEQTAAAARTLQTQAEDLAAQVARFRVPA